MALARESRGQSHWIHGVALRAGHGLGDQLRPARKPEFVELPEWSDVGVPGALFGAGIPREIADLVPFRVSRDRVTAYINAMREAANEWLTSARLEDLEGVTDLKARRFSKPEYMEPETWSELERLHGIPRWQFLVRPTVSHIRIHYGEVRGQLESIRSGAAAAG